MAEAPITREAGLHISQIPLIARNKLQLQGPDEMMRILTRSNSRVFQYSDGIENVKVEIIVNDNSRIVFQEVSFNSRRRFEFFKRMVTHCYESIPTNHLKPRVLLILGSDTDRKCIELSVSDES